MGVLANNKNMLLKEDKPYGFPAIPGSVLSVSVLTIRFTGGRDDKKACPYHLSTKRLSNTTTTPLFTTSYQTAKTLSKPDHSRRKGIRRETVNVFCRESLHSRFVDRVSRDLERKLNQDHA